MVSAYKNAIRQLWVGSCNVYVRQPTLDEATGKTVFDEVLTIENEPCRISFKTVTTAGEKDHAAPVEQVTELFISSEVTIPEGSKIVVTQNGVTSAYQRSGKPAVYSTHQEIILEVFKEWA